MRNPLHRTGHQRQVRRAVTVAAAGVVLAVTGLGWAVHSHADPGCTGPDGAPCAPTPPGCVQPDNSLPCSSSLPDINAAIGRELRILLGTGLGR